MKKFNITALTLAVSLMASAVPAKRITFTVAQPDGSTLTLTRQGDENFHTLLTTDGLAVTGNASEGYRYHTASGLKGMLAHDAGYRSADEAAFLKANLTELTFEAVAKNAPVRSTGIAPRSGALKKPSGTADLRVSADVPCTGTPRIPVILVAYSDYDFIHGDAAADTFTDFFQKGDQSANAYFRDQSNGLFDPQFDIYGPVTLSGKRSAYGANDYSGNDKGVGTMVGEACQMLDSSIDFSKYDNDGDGVCDVVIVLYAGDGEASSARPNSSNAVWPCQWYLSASDFGKYLRLDGVQVNKFAVFNELNGTPYEDKIDGVGTVVHEFSHCIGLPDFYPTSQYSSVRFAMDAWSLMDMGCYNNDGYTPIGYSAFEKYSLGWLSLEEPEASRRYTLPVFNAGKQETDVALKLNSDNENEYYIVENRQCQGWDSYMESEGLLITHVTYNSNTWYSNSPNNTRPLGYCVVPADNSMSTGNLYGDLWPYGNKNSFTDSSTPAATLNKSTKRLGKPITDMVQNPDGTVSLWYDKDKFPLAITPEVPDSIDSTNTAITPTSFTAVWIPAEGAADAEEVAYTLEVSRINATAEATAKAPATEEPTIITDIHGTSYKMEGLASGANYQYRVKAHVTLGGETYESEWSPAVKAYTPLPSGIATAVAPANDAPAEYFTLQGVRLGGKPSAPGIYILRTQGRTSKVVVR